MKIRIKGNSLRYRLTRPEVATLEAAGRLEERTAFTGKTLVYAIETASNDRMTADFIENGIVLYVPRVMIDELYHTGKVGFDDRSGPVSLLIEKDFACIDNTEEDQSDHYPNPSLSCD